MSRSTPPEFLRPADTFVRRHLGPSPDEVEAMLAALGCASLDELVGETVPASIRLGRELDLGPERGEHEFLAELRELAGRNRVRKSFIGQGYHGTITPPVVLRNVLENPGWYTQYTPYQAEISQGRLEALLVFQTMVADLVGLPLANASLLDEATAAAEALCLCHRQLRGKRNTLLLATDCHPQTIAVVRTRAAALGIEVSVGIDPGAGPEAYADVAGVLLQYPATDGSLVDPTALIERAHAGGALVVAATDLLACVLVTPPGELGADVCVGSSQRFGVPLGFGGPHAAFLATRDEYRRQVPGRIIGVSIDGRGAPALRMALQTREQHIRREKATSNICTAQALLAIVSAMYAVYHGPEGLRRIARDVHGKAAALALGLSELGYTVPDHAFFGTVTAKKAGTAERVHAAARERGFNLQEVDGDTVRVALDETATAEDLEALLAAFAAVQDREAPELLDLAERAETGWPAPLTRRSEFLRHPVFQEHRAEHEMLRYLKRLESRDLSLTTSMIPLGSCTMKLNATSEMLPLTWPEIADLHPFVPADQAAGYHELFRGLEADLCEITGFAAMSFQPNAGSQGEYLGLLTIRAWHEERGETARDVCLIPVSAHGTNPASAIMAGMRVVTVACDDDGNIDVSDLERKAEQHSGNLAALMVTYPSTHGVFEESIRDVCRIVHEHGGQVYMDGANMNAQVGLCRPADVGADVCHLNLHKTFCIPHGGGGPGMGPIGVAAHLAPFLPGHPLVETGGEKALGPVAAAPWGSPSVLPISYAYVRLMGARGLRRATEVAILNANYMAKRLEEHYPILYRGAHGRVAHEFILDLRPFERSAGVVGEDVAKRLIDYGFHAPTQSFPVAGTLMIEPTESESKAELDRLCDALISIKGEIRAIEEGRWPRDDNPLENAPHTADQVAADTWTHPYGRETAAFPAPWTREHKVWPHVTRVDNGYGDRNLVVTCPTAEDEELREETLSAPQETVGVSG